MADVSDLLSMLMSGGAQQPASAQPVAPGVQNSGVQALNGQIAQGNVLARLRSALPGAGTGGGIGSTGIGSAGGGISNLKTNGSKFGAFAQGLGAGMDASAAQAPERRKLAMSQALGQLMGKGDYAGAAQAAFSGGDPTTGMALIKAKQALDSSAAFNAGIQKTYGGGATAPSTAPGAAPATAGSPATAPAGAGGPVPSVAASPAAASSAPGDDEGTSSTAGAAPGPATSIASAPSIPGANSHVMNLIRLSALPGLSDSQQKTLGTLLSNELDKTKLPDDVKKYFFSRSAAGGGFTGTFQEFQDKTSDTPDKKNYDVVVQQAKDAGQEPPSFQQYLQTKKPATQVNIDQKGEGAEAQESGKMAANRQNAMLQSAEGAPDRIARLQLLRNVLQKTQTGPISGMLGTAGGLATAIGMSPDSIKSLGIDPNQATNNEIANKLAGELVVGSIGAKNGGFPASNFSLAERQFIEKMFPNIQAQTGSNDAVADVLIAKDQRNLQMAQAFSDYKAAQRAAGKPISYGDFEDQWLQQHGQDNIFQPVIDKFNNGGYSPNGAAPPTQNPPAGQQPGLAGQQQSQVAPADGSQPFSPRALDPKQVEQARAAKPEDVYAEARARAAAGAPLDQLAQKLDRLGFDPAPFLKDLAQDNAQDAQEDGTPSSGQPSLADAIHNRAANGAPAAPAAAPLPAAPVDNSSPAPASVSMPQPSAPSTLAPALPQKGASLDDPGDLSSMLASLFGSSNQAAA